MLGCEGSAPSEGGATSGYLLADGPATCVVDLGFGTAAGLLERLDGAAPDALALTHRHEDHWADLPLLAEALGGARPVLLAPAELLGSLAPELLASFDARELGAGTQRAAAWSIEARRGDHGPETYALLVRGPSGARLLLSADTGPEVHWEGWADGAVFLCEASYARHREGSLRHLSGREAGRLAGEVAAGELWLTHLQAGEDQAEVLAEAEAAFAGPVLAVARGASYRVG